MVITTKCELERLGKDAMLHETLKSAIDRSFKNTFLMGPSIGTLVDTGELLHDLIALRDLHNIPNDGSCFNCSGDKCIRSENTGGVKNEYTTAKRMANV
jgi:hypothetical protein